MSSLDVDGSGVTRKYASNNPFLPAALAQSSSPAAPHGNASSSTAAPNLDSSAFAAAAPSGGPSVGVSDDSTMSDGPVLQPGTNGKPAALATDTLPDLSSLSLDTSDNAAGSVQQLAPQTSQAQASSSLSSPTSLPSSPYAPPTGPPPQAGASTNSIYSPPPVPPPDAAVQQASPFAPPPGPPPPSSPSTYSPPPGPPPPQNEPPRFNPTTVPVPGQPLLREGKLLMYPRGWPGCPKCQDTGYKHFNPTHPCRTCWQRYGKPYSGPVAYASNLGGGAVLQRPLPARPQHNSSQPYGPQSFYGSAGGGMSGMHSHPHAPSGFPGAALVHHHAGGYNGYGHPQSGPSYAAPVNSPLIQSPPPQLGSSVRPAGPPRVNRAGDASEAAADPDGEAPPAYDEVVRTQHALPPQTSGGSIARPSPGSTSSSGSFVPPPHPPPNAPPLQGSYSGPQYAHSHSYSPHSPHQGPPHGWSPHPHNAGGPHAAPLVVQPGDPRIGGTLCYKCGGRGLKESFWFGDETCYVCGGMGRIFRQ